MRPSTHTYLGQNFDFEEMTCGKHFVTNHEQDHCCCEVNTLVQSAYLMSVFNFLFLIQCIKVPFLRLDVVMGTLMQDVPSNLFGSNSDITNPAARMGLQIQVFICNKVSYQSRY